MTFMNSFFPTIKNEVLKGKGCEGKRKGFEGKGKGHEQKFNKNEGDFYGSLVHHQHRHGKNLTDLEHHRQNGFDPILHEFSSIFSSTPCVQPARDHDFSQIFSATPVV